MVRDAVLAAVIAVGAGGTAVAQGFSGSGAAGVAQLRGATASPGLQSFYGYGADRAAPDLRAAPVRRGRPIAIDDAPRDGAPEAFGLQPWR